MVLAFLAGEYAKRKYDKRREREITRRKLYELELAIQKLSMFIYHCFSVPLVLSLAEEGNQDIFAGRTLEHRCSSGEVGSDCEVSGIAK